MDDDKNLSGEFILNKTATPSQPEQVVGNETLKVDTLHHPVFPGIRKNRLSFYSSLCIDPHNISIINQDKDETVHLLARRHLITNIFWVVGVILLLFAPLTIPLFLFQFSFIEFSPTTVMSALMLYYLSLFGYSLLKFCEWYFHVGLVSNKRIVDVDLANILSKNVAETDVKSVEDVSYTQKGIIQSIFNFGNVFIQTEAVMANFEFDRTPHPSQVAEIISQASQFQKKGELS
jgi:hypothetical protein